MNCPHCSTAFHPQFAESHLKFGYFHIFLYQQACPSCGKYILDVLVNDQSNPERLLVPRFTAFPDVPTIRPIPQDVPEPCKQDFIEAVQTLGISPKASAALSRRIIQALLREQAGTKSKDLRDQIDEVLNAKIFPSYIADDLHAVRNIGNFAAHEMKDKLSGEILDVEPGEAEWTLDVAAAMLDFYFVEPAKAVKRRTELNEKLKAAGKPEIAEASTAPTKVQQTGESADASE
jgi:Domain of unknown function (DUF4145)